MLLKRICRYLQQTIITDFANGARIISMKNVLSALNQLNKIAVITVL